MRMLEGEDRRRYNAARHEEVAAIFIGEDGAPPVGCEIVVYPCDQPLRQINHLSANVDPMSYPLLFPRGDAGWDTSLTHDDDRRTRERYKLTQLQYYAYRLAVREGFSAIHRAGKLLQQFSVDAYVKVEGQRLDFLNRNQHQWCC